MSFKPIQNKFNYEDYKNIKIIYKDNNFANLNSNNLEIVNSEDHIDDRNDQKLSYKLNKKDNKYNELCYKIIENIQKINGKLITNISNITNYKSVLEYSCECGHIMKKCCEEITKCSKCLNKNIIENILVKDNIEYKKFEFGWISSNGLVLDFKQNNIEINTEGYLNIDNKKFNIKNLIVQNFDIQNKDNYLKPGYSILQKINNNDYSINNLIISNKKDFYELDMFESLEELEYVDDNLDYHLNIKNKIINAMKDEDCKSIESEIYKNITVYDNGIIKYNKTNKYTIGSGYPGILEVNINNCTVYVDRLIAATFLPLRNKYRLQDYNSTKLIHIDGNIHNNTVINLKWDINKYENIPVNIYSCQNYIKDKFIKRYPNIIKASEELNISENIIYECIRYSKSYKNKYYFEDGNDEIINIDQEDNDIIVIDNNEKINIEKVSEEEGYKTERNFYESIRSFMKENNYELLTNIYSLKRSRDSVNYKCKCGIEYTRRFNIIDPHSCEECIKLELIEPSIDNGERIEKIIEGKKWIYLEGKNWICEDGIAVKNVRKNNPLEKEFLNTSNILTLDSKQRYFINGSNKYATRLLAKAFKIEYYEKLNKGWVVSIKDKNKPICLQNIVVTTFNETNKNNGLNSHKSERFLEAMNKDIEYYLKNINYKVLQEFPNHYIFEDGSIYNK